MLISYEEFVNFQWTINWKVGQTMHQWADILLEQLVLKTNSINATLYCADNKHRALYLIATHSVNKAHLLQQRFELGEGLVGLVAQKQQTKILTETIPEQFCNTFGCGQIMPSHVIIIPLVFNKATYGVIELSSVHSYSSQMVQFLESTLANVGTQLVLLIKESEQLELLTSIEAQNEEILEKNDRLSSLYNEVNAINDQLSLKNQVLEETRDELIAKRKQLRAKNMEAERSLSSLELISKFGQKITANLNWTSLRKQIYKYVETMLETDAFGVGQLNAQRTHLIFDEIFLSKHKNLVDLKIPIDSNNSLASWCFNNKKPIIIGDLEKEYDKYLKEAPSFGNVPRPLSLIYIPLTIKDQAIGVITINCDSRNAYSKADLSNVISLASYIAIALDNARMYRHVNLQNAIVKESIQYAQTIQRALLPQKTELDAAFESFILFRPRDIVSGDFFWCYKKPISENQSYFFVAAVDCTGHGVPGAFISIIGTNILNEIIRHNEIVEPESILLEMDGYVRALLKQDELSNDDGMDVCLCRFLVDEQDRLIENKVVFAGAKRCLFLYNTDEKTCTTVKGTPRSIGGMIFKHVDFSQKELTFNPNDCLYLSSDGFVDQCNEQRSSYSSRRFKQLIEQHADKPMIEQEQAFTKELQNYMGDASQRDDILIIGIRQPTSLG